MTETELATTLRRLGVDARSHRALALLPLIQVAWADGRIQAAERAMIEDIARARYGLDDQALRVVDRWLREPPTAEDIDAGQRAMSALARHVVGQAQWDQAIDRLAQADEAIDDIPTDVRDVEDLRREYAPTEPAAPRRAVAPGSRAALCRGDGRWPVTEALTIGRHGSNDLVIRDDGKVSRHHCRVVAADGAWRLEDTGSTNGTVVDGVPVRSRPLYGGETVVIGNTTFTFVVESGPVTP